MRTILALSQVLSGVFTAIREGERMPSTTMGLLCFVMGLLAAFAILTPFLEQALY